MAVEETPRGDPRHAQDDARACASSRRRPSGPAARPTIGPACTTRSLIKENHAALRRGGIGEAVRRAREARPRSGRSRWSAATLEEVDQALAAGAGVGGFRILLDKHDPGTAARGGRTRPRGRAELEASGGATLEALAEIAETGVDFISVGALTHRRAGA